MLLRTLIVAGTLMALPTSPDLRLVETILDVPSAQEADSLDIISSGGIISHVEYSTKLPAVTPALPSPLPSLTIKPQAVPFGRITDGSNDQPTTGKLPGGFTVDLGSSGRVRNLLPYNTITITGSWSGIWQVALADEDQAKRSESTHLGFLESNDIMTLPLNQALVAKSDISRARYLIFSLIRTKGELHLRTITCQRDEITAPPPQTAVWIFNTQKLRRQGDSVADELVSKGIKRAYVQIDDDPGQLYTFMRAATKLGIKVYALEGTPDSLKHSPPLLARVAAVIAYNRQYAEAPFAGLQLDIAPHGLRDFGIRRTYYSERYLSLLKEVASQCRSLLPLSIIVPHWFTRIPAEGQNLTARTLVHADELVVTCDRTQFSELAECARDTLLWGERFNKTVYVGIKAGPVPDEGHFVLRKSRNKKGSDLTELAGIAWEQEGAYTIPSENTTFFGKPTELSKLLAKTRPHSSFGGWVINSYENLK